MAKTPQEEKVLIEDNSHRAEDNIAVAEQNLPAINEVWTMYHNLGFDRRLKNGTDLEALVHNFESFIQEERLKQVPDEVAGMKIKKLDFLNKFVERPAAIDELKEKTEQLKGIRFGFNLYKFDEKTNQFAICRVSCQAYREDHRSYATGNQVKVIRVAEKMAELLNELVELGYPVTAANIINPVGISGPIERGAMIDYVDHNARHSGVPYFKVANPGFSTKIQP